MGDRASVSFANGAWDSVAVFSHWGGKQFQDDARRYVDELKADIRRTPKKFDGLPLGRLEPQTVVLDFLRWYLESREVGMKPGDRVVSNLYLGCDGMDGDNSDNGHVRIQLEEG